MRYAYALVPFGVGVWLAHYGFHFLTGVGTVVPVTQSAVIDAAGGALLGAPDWRWLGMRPGAVFPLQLGVVLLGALGSLVLVHRISERDHPGRRGARRGALEPRHRRARRPGVVDPRAADGDARDGARRMSRRAHAAALVAIAGLLGSGARSRGAQRPAVSDPLGPDRRRLSTSPSGPIRTPPTTGRRPGSSGWCSRRRMAASAIPAATQASVAIRPLDREGPTREGRAEPVNNSVTRQFVALLMDHEGPFGVRVAVDGPLGRAAVDSQVDATYDLRPAPGLIALYLVPFVLVGGLWVKVLLRRRQRRRS